MKRFLRFPNLISLPLLSFFLFPNFLVITNSSEYYSENKKSTFWKQHPNFNVEEYGDYAFMLGSSEENYPRKGIAAKNQVKYAITPSALDSTLVIKHNQGHKMSHADEDMFDEEPEEHFGHPVQNLNQPKLDMEILKRIRMPIPILSNVFPTNNNTLHNNSVESAASTTQKSVKRHRHRKKGRRIISIYSDESIEIIRKSKKKQRLPSDYDSKEDKYCESGENTDQTVETSTFNM